METKARCEMELVPKFSGLTRAALRDIVHAFQPM